MKNVNVKLWQKDFETDLPVFPVGEFIELSLLKKPHELPEYMRNVPVLCGHFEPPALDFTRDVPTHVGWGSVQVGESRALTFRLQRGSHLMYWFANAADQCVWDAIQKWAQAGIIVLGVDVGDGRVALAKRDFEADPRYAAERFWTARAEEITPTFMAEVGQMILRDEVRAMASSDIPSVRRLQRVQSCVVATARTPHIILDIDDDSPGSQSPIGLVRRLQQRMLGKGAQKH